ncbi:tRNA (adenosine(37)-N6)-dimethylallyltransferase MiaA [Candidatus Shapirobacteria bacterium RBG_13_44_7]|uniref:tRNA dimethylallyltransferase n=1 Tax=Candidatus Shapirobacteria bacterium RBG_13_44_7 TaxID=1802149 RepID=A0A1F7SEW3_9BACT|nr:MAG: tRNA (adenosine(37)-N6)-dimethylallyltransferase MiaA [Candidatus Shapirobacteria bacterium RBG_13_44_7]
MDNTHQLLIISGPTATGKTALAAKLAKKFNGELISADSRQIYQSLDIGTGKDHPRGVKLHLIDLIPPNLSFSVAQYRQFALSKIKDIHSRNKLPIIVGGTGQYLDSIINPRETFSIPPNHLLRFFLNRLPVSLLQKLYFLLDKNSFLKLNNSDRYNPHRLIRKIEIKLSNPKVKNPKPAITSYLHLSLTASNSYLYPRIDARVEKRLKIGLLDEIKKLLSLYKWSDPGLNTLAYQEFRPYFQKHSPIEESIQKWRFHEHAYARRQKTWFKKQKNIIFVDISQSKFDQKVTTLVSKWYNQS